MIISELVGGEVVSVDPYSTLREAASVMHEREVGSVAVVVDDALEGILTERDILRAVAKGLEFDDEEVSSHMTLLPDTFGPELSVQDAADWMLATGYRHLPVVETSGRVFGMVSIKDILWALTDPAAV
jgi:CBS domain-containing protein